MKRAARNISWDREDTGRTALSVVYTLQREHGLDEPPFYTPWYLGGDGMWIRVPNRFMHMGWMTKARAKDAAERHYSEITGEVQR